ncbi:hypothetical protein ACQKWADRAFT_235544 [Trichoderma austrokoningii]
MGLKQFNHDLAAAKEISISAAVSNVRRGDSDGEAAFTWSSSSNDITTSLDIQVLILDVDSYPKTSGVMVFTESEHSTVDVSSVLERLSPSLASKNIEAIIRAVAAKLSAKLELAHDAGTDIDSDSVPDLSDYDELESEYDDDGDGDLHQASSLQASLNTLPNRPIEATASIKRLKRDLRAAQSAGISIGVFPRRELRDAEFFSLSLRVMRLGIPEHALEAWGLEDDEYLVLLCRFAPHYPTVPEVWNNTFEDWRPQFRFGKCSKPKPSVETSRLAFLTIADGTLDKRQVDESGESESESDENSDDEAAKEGFIPLYMSNSINMLMNADFLRLLRLRRQNGLSWDGAIRLHKLLAKKGHQALEQQGPSEDDTSEDLVFENSMPSLRHDYALDDEAKLSLPMVAMQFALRRLVRCTKYCMVCHQRLEDEFEALKPYICSSPLCSYQFVTLGLGASLEHEIIHNPYVVDILISFFASALTNPTSLRQYPTGLNLKSVSTGSRANPLQHSVAEACFLERSIRLNPADYLHNRNIKIGDTILVVVDSHETSPHMPILNGHLERHVCKVTNIISSICSFEVITTILNPVNVLPLSEEEVPTQLSNTAEEWVTVLIFQYSIVVDDLNPVERSAALSLILRGIPRVLDMRAYILSNPSKGLASWSLIDKNALTLLQWIISSNRSLILQDDAVPSPTDDNSSQDLETAEATNPNKVKGIPSNWMQFRFLQGTPERERLFTKELAAVSQSNMPESSYPSIFAWHGSPLRNWHSIIRTGLDFQTVASGRSYGDGVYMSKKFSVSIAYSDKMHPPKISPSPSLYAANHWPNSVLRPSSAISICEVVNRTEEFLRKEPHYVVNKIEWIQCRYLFVAVNPEQRATQQPFPTRPKTSCVGYIFQCPSNQLLAAFDKPVHIPLSAVPSNRQCLSSDDHHVRSKAKEAPTMALDDHGETDHELLLDSEDEVIGNRRKRRYSSPSLSDRQSTRLKSIDSEVPSGEGDLVRLKTKFTSGDLDLQTIPRLPEPSWASTSPIALKSLNRAIKEMYKIQSSEDITSLGWYIDFDNLNNVFHWIVELHSFELDLPLAKDMEKAGCTSIVLEFRFGASFPFSPPFVRVVRPRFLPFARGGGGHVTVGGAICSEILTNSGWSAVMTIEKVLLQIRLGLTELDPPARLQIKNGTSKAQDYSIGEAVDAYQRAAKNHGWAIPEDIQQIGQLWVTNDE